MDETTRNEEQTEKVQDQNQAEYEEPSLVDLEDVSGGNGAESCCTGGSAAV